MLGKNESADVFLRLLPLVSFAIPLVILYFLAPTSFEATWKGRTYHLFFLWLVLLETILNWETLQPLRKLKTLRFVSLVVALSLPTIYIVVANYYGLNVIILDLSRRIGIPWADQMPLSYEYLVFAVFLAYIVLLEYGIRNLGNFALSTLFSGTIGAIYTIDNLYPFGRFAPFQLIVPTTTTLAASVLSFMGYSTTLNFITTPAYGSMPYLSIRDSLGRSTGFGVAWPCSGVESLLIYTVTILLFLRNSPINWAHRIVYFALGAIVTYAINIMRIVTIFLISINTGGGNTLPTQEFHNYYGQLYSIIWIVSYPLIIVAIQFLGSRIRFRRSKDSKKT